MGWLAMDGRVVSGGGGGGGCEGVAGCEGASSFSFGFVYASIISPVPCGTRYDLQRLSMVQKQIRNVQGPGLSALLRMQLPHCTLKMTVCVASRRSGSTVLMFCTFSSARAMAALRFAFALSAGAAAPPSASCTHIIQA
jgi:hypothetical protein